MAPAAVAQHDRLNHRGPVQLVLVIERRSRADALSDWPALYRPYQPRVEKSVKPWGMSDMMKSRFSEEQIIGFLKQADAGMPIKEAAAG